MKMGKMLLIRLGPSRALAERKFSLGLFRKSKNSFDIAIHNLEAIRSKLKNESEGADLDPDAIGLLGRLKKHRRSVDSKIRQIEKSVKGKAFLEEVGKAYILYRDAEGLRISGPKNYKLAREKYLQIIRNHPDTTYAEASHVYAPMCLVMIGGHINVQKAELELIKFYETKPRLGLYRGEALLELGRIALEHQLDLDKSTKYFDALVGWIRGVRNSNRSIVLKGVTPRALQFITPPVQEWSEKDFLGKSQAGAVKDWPVT